MGKGDIRSKRGKIFRGTHGNSRRRQKEKAKKRRKGASQGTGAPPPPRPPALPPRASRTMTNHWILKTEPSAYSFDQLERERTAVWDGVKNPLALKHLRAMQPGDEVMIYHTGDEKAVVGTAVVATAAYPDPKMKDPALVVVDLKAGERLPRPVPLTVIKGDPAFKDLALVRMPRLSVVPATAAQWSRLMALSGGGKGS